LLLSLPDTATQISMLNFTFCPLRHAELPMDELLCTNGPSTKINAVSKKASKQVTEETFFRFFEDYNL